MKVLIHLEMKSPCLISHQNGSKSLTFGVAHTHTAIQGVYHPSSCARHPFGGPGLSPYFSKMLKVRCFQILLDDGILYLLYAASSLKCQACGPGDVPCDGSNVRSIQCDDFADRCMTAKVTMNIPNLGPYTSVMKNCSYSAVICKESGPGYRKYS